MANGARCVDMNPIPEVNASTSHATPIAADAAQIAQPAVRRNDDGAAVIYGLPRHLS